MMIEWLRRRDLPALWQAGPDLMTFIASYFLMLRMVKADAECGRRFRSARIAAQLMTGSTGRDIAAT
jgi:hypothetical protein